MTKVGVAPSFLGGPTETDSFSDPTTVDTRAKCDPHLAIPRPPQPTLGWASWVGPPLW